MFTYKVVGMFGASIIFSYISWVWGFGDRWFVLSWCS